MKLWIGVGFCQVYLFLHQLRCSCGSSLCRKRWEHIREDGSWIGMWERKGRVNCGWDLHKPCCCVTSRVGPQGTPIFFFFCSQMWCSSNWSVALFRVLHYLYIPMISLAWLWTTAPLVCCWTLQYSWWRIFILLLIRDVGLFFLCLCLALESRYYCFHKRNQEGWG